MTTPAPVPSYRLPRPRSMFGPIMLVGIAVVLLLCTTGVLGWHSFLWWFARYWPVVLILWGVAKLAEYLWARQQGYPPPRLGAGSIVFLIFFILFGTVLTRAAGLNWPGIRHEIETDSGWNGVDGFGSGYNFE